MPPELEAPVATEAAAPAVEAQQPAPAANEQSRDDAGKFAVDPAQRFADRLAAVNAEREAAEAAAAAPAAPAENTEQQPADDKSPSDDPAAPSSEGPSDLLLMAAAQMGVPQHVLALAKNDDQVRIAMAMAPPRGGQSQQAPQQPASPEPSAESAAWQTERQAKLTLPDDYMDASDPLIQQIKHLIEIVNKRGEDVDVVASWAGRQMESHEEQARASAQSTYDAAVDSMAWPEFGTIAQIDSPNAPQIQLRSMLYGPYREIADALPHMPKEQVLELAYERVFNRKPTPKVTPQQAAKKAAIVQQSSARLGGGIVGPPSAEPPLSPAERFRRRFQGE